MWKKWAQRAGKLVVIVGLLVALLEVGIHILSHSAWFRTQVEQALHNSLGREFTIGRMGAGLGGVFVEDIKVAEAGGFEQGTFLEAGHLRVRLSLIHLLHLHGKIKTIVLSNVTVRARTRADGTNSWEDFLSTATQPAAAETASQNAGIPIRVTATRVRLNDLHLIYIDETTSRTLDAQHLTVHADHLSLHEPFTVKVYAKMSHTQNGVRMEIPLSLKAKVQLANLDLKNAWLDINPFSATYNGASLRITGRAENFEKPQLELRAQIRDLSDQVLHHVATLPPFELPKADFTLRLAADPQVPSVTLHHAALQAPGVAFEAKGGVVLTENTHYEFTSKSTLELAQIGQWFTLVATPYQLLGTVDANLKATSNELQAEVTLQEVGGFVAQAGQVSNVNALVQATEQMDFKHGTAQAELTGKLNGRELQASLKATQQPDVIKLVTTLKAKELIVVSKPTPTDTAQTPAASEALTAQPAWPLPPVDVEADMQLGRVQGPYVTAEDLNFTADVTGLTPALNQAHGTLHFSSGKGKIQDLYKLTNANPVTKVLFLSLDVTGKVFNSLNVLGVLQSIGGGISSAVTGDTEKDTPVHTQTVLGPDGEAIEVPVLAQTQNTSGELAYDKFDTTVSFTHGTASIKEGSFVSTMMSFRLDGTVDFNTNALDLTVRAAPGKHEVDGMMPLTLKIGGTVEDPQGSMQLLGSVGALVKQSVANNVVSRHVTKGVKSLFGLFKKDKDPAPDTPAPQE